MNRFRRENRDRNKDTSQRPRPLREFSHAPQNSSSSLRGHRFRITIFWLIPVVVFLGIVLVGGYFAFSFQTEEKVDASGDSEFAFSPSSGEIEISELISAHLKAIGGRNNLQQVRSVRYEGRVRFEAAEKDFQMLLLMPDMGMLVTNPDEPGNLKLMLNGDYAWQVLEGPDGAREVSPLDENNTKSLKWSMRIHNTFRRMALDGRYANSSVKEVEYNGDRCYQFTKKMPNGFEFSAILEQETFYLLKTEETVVGKNGPDTFSVVYDDHRMVAGLVEPFKTQLYRNGELDNEVLINSIRVNPGVISSLFEVPEEIRR